MREPLRISLILAAAMLLISCHGARTGASSQTAVPSPAHSGAYAFQGGRAMSFALHAASFANRAAIPARYTCDGAGLSPGLSWTGVPAGAQSLALIADDPDAPMGTWNHWVIWNIPASATQLPEGVPAVVLLDDGTRQGLNSFRRLGYGGPCPPPGKPHRYFFRLYALDAQLDVKPGAGRSDLERAMERHVIVQTEWMGTYKR